MNKQTNSILYSVDSGLIILSRLYQAGQIPPSDYYDLRQILLKIDEDTLQIKKEGGVRDE